MKIIGDLGYCFGTDAKAEWDKESVKWGNEEIQETWLLKFRDVGLR